MKETEPEGHDLADELKSLGENLRRVVRAGWASQERQRFQRDLEAGLTELAETVAKAAQDFAASPPGQRLGGELKELGERVRSGDLEADIRDDIVAVLRRANVELDRVVERMRSAEPEQRPNEASE